MTLIGFAGNFSGETWRIKKKKKEFTWLIGRKCAARGTEAGWACVKSWSSRVRIMREKYIKDSNLFTAPITCSSSWGWKSIVKGRSIVELGASWRVGNGKALKFWSDWWVGSKPIGLEWDLEIPDNLANVMVADFILESKEWDVPKLEEILPSSKINEIRAIPIPEVENAEDTILWAKSPTGSFSVSSVFLSLVGTTEEDVDISWVWSIKCTEKIKAFLWLLAKEKLLTNKECHRKHLTDDDRCPQCNEEEESLAHTFVHCNFA